MRLVLVFSLVPLLWGTVRAAEAVRPVPAGQRQLFLDDQNVEQTENLTRTMHSPEKRGAVIRSPNPKRTIQTRSAPVWDAEEEVFKLWVLGIDETFWRSPDGLHWSPGPRPNLRTDHVVYDPTDADPARRFKAPLLNEGFAVSPDGVRWTRLNVPAIPNSDEGNFSFDPLEGTFLHTVKRGAGFGRAVALAVSRDFQSWTDYGVVFQADEVDQELGREQILVRRSDPTLQQTFHHDPDTYRVDVYNMGVFHYEGLYLGMPALYHATGPMPNYPNTDGFHLVQLTSSRDLKTWVRLGDRQPFLGPSRLESGAYDLTQILPPSAPVVQDDELWFYYTGLKYRGAWTYVGTFPNGEYVPLPGKGHDHGAVCLAVLRRDGFVSLDAGDEPGMILTAPFLLGGTALHVNVDATDGEMNVAVLDGDGRTVAVSEPITGDRPRAALKWKSGDPATLTGQTARLRCTLRNARFYSYWCTEAPD